MPEITLERRDLRKLRVHPWNQKLYGPPTVSQEFIDRIDPEIGLIDKIVIVPDGTIISGHRRREGLIAKQQHEDRCIVRYDLEDKPRLILKAVILANDYRIRTPEIMAREAAALAEIEAAEAAERRSSGTSYSNVQAHHHPAKSPDGKQNEPKCTDSQHTPKSAEREKQGETRELVAKHLGVGAKKADEAIKVGQAIKQAEDRGDKETAAKIAETANTKSIHAAAKLVSEPKKATKPPKPEIPERLKPVFELVDDFKRFEKMYCPNTQELAEKAAVVIFGSKKDSLIDVDKVCELMGKIFTMLMPWMPDRVCDCGGSDLSCRTCRGRGWLPKSGKQR